MKKYIVIIASLSAVLSVFFAGLMLFGFSVYNSTGATATKPAGFKMAAIPADLTVPQDRADYLVTHYWDNFDFTNTDYTRLPEVTEQVMVNYIELLPTASKPIAYESIQATLKSAEDDAEMRTYFLGTYKKYLYDANSPLRNEEYFIPVLNYVLNSEYSSGLEAEQAKLALNSIVNDKDSVNHFSDYMLAMIEDGHLHNAGDNYTVLFLHDPECLICEEIANEMKNSLVINEEMHSRSVNILAFATEVNNHTWQYSLNGTQANNWVNNHKKELVTANSNMGSRAIAELYLIDNNRQVLLRNTTISTIEAYLKNNRRFV